MTNKIKIIIGLVALAIVLVLFKTPIYILATKDTVQITVSKTEVKKKNGDDKYLVFTKEGETFENTDSYWCWKLNSSDLHGALQEDSTYNVNVYGIRSNLFSTYRNITNINE
jgi:hypothetical protein